MARTTQNPRLINRTVRAKLSSRRDPYWHLIAEGQHLGYRRTETTGTWIARMYDRASGRRFQALGTADDIANADGKTVLTFAQAIEAAQVWFRRRTMEDTGEVVGGPYTVAQAMADYLTERERAKRKRLADTRAVINAHILPKLGSIELSKLTHGRVKAWRDAVAEAAPRSRTKVGKPQTFRDYDPNDAEAVRRRQATANRVLTILKAALNYAHAETKRVATKAAWETVKPFRDVDVPKIRFLAADELPKFLPRCPDDFGQLVHGALLTGGRYGELTHIPVSSFDPVNETIFIPANITKNGKSRYVSLNDEGVAFFTRHTASRDVRERMFLRANGKPWKKSEQKRPMDDACATAGIEPATFHILRHTYASHLAMNGTPMQVIADQLGHSDTRITERHYAHLSRDHVRAVIRRNLPTFGIGAPGPVLVESAAYA